MKYFILACITTLYSISGVVSQPLSIDFPLQLGVQSANIGVQTLDLSPFQVNDFIAVSIILEGSQMHSNAVQCRVQTGEGWKNMPHFGEEAREGRFVGELLFIPAEFSKKLVFNMTFETGIEMAAVKGRIHVFSPTAHDPSISSTNMEELENGDLCVCPKPSFVPRTIWGAAFGLTNAIYTPPAVYTNVTHLIVHHSAGTNTSDSWSDVVASIFDFHVNTNGWSDVGYNWLIDPNGVLYDGRGGGDNVRGAHMCGFNSRTMGVCLLGNFVDNPPPPLALETLTKLLSWKCCKEDIIPDGRGSIISYPGTMKYISGHRDGCAPNTTECPGELLFGVLDSVRLSTKANIENICSNPLDILTPMTKGELVAFPNPANTKIQIKWADIQPAGQIQILDPFGKLVGEYTVGTSEQGMVFDIEHLTPGLYWFAFQTDARIFTTRFMKF